MRRIKDLQAQVLSEVTPGLSETPARDAALGHSLNLVLTSCMFVQNFICHHSLFK